MSDIYQVDSELVDSATIAPAVVQNAPSTSKRVAFWFGMGLVFVYASMLNQLLSYVAHHNFRLLYIFGVPAIIGVLASGSILQALRSRPVILWVCFGVWGAMAIPFSIWKSGAVHQMIGFWRSGLLLMFVIAGLPRTWRDCRVLMSTIAAAAAVSLLATRFLGKTAATERLSLDFGTVANANDLAAHLLFVLPFLLWVVLSSKSRLLRLFALCAVVGGVFVVLDTGSRGSLVALVFDALFFMFASRSRYRMAFAVVAPIILAFAILVLPGVVRNRLMTFSASQADANQEAIASSEARERLLRDSIICALQNPVFGIGPGQFTTYEVANGFTGNVHTPKGHWHDAHNSYTLAASECGIPALLLYLAAVWCTWRLLGAVGRRIRGNPRLLDMTNAVFCIRLAMVGFCVAIFFLNFTYLYYLPAMAGLSTAFASAARNESSKSIADTHDESTLHFTWSGPASA